MGLLYRQFYDNANSNNLRQFYLSCIRPHLEYACTVWDPTSLRRLRYWKMCKSLLAKYAANHGSWIMIVCWRIWIYHLFNKGGYSNLMYQFVHKDSFIPEGLLLSHPPSNYNMRNFSYFIVPYARTNAYYNSFFPHMKSYTK